MQDVTQNSKKSKLWDVNSELNKIIKTFNRTLWFLEKAEYMVIDPSKSSFIVIYGYGMVVCNLFQYS